VSFILDCSYDFYYMLFLERFIFVFYRCQESVIISGYNIKNYSYFFI